MTCPHCSGALYRDDDEIRCILCGREVIFKNGRAEIKQRGDMRCVPMYYQEKRDWLENRKDELVQDSETITILEILEKWGLSRTTWFNIRRRWELPIKRRGNGH